MFRFNGNFDRMINTRYHTVFKINPFSPKFTPFFILNSRIFKEIQINELIFMFFDRKYKIILRPYNNFTFFFSKLMNVSTF
ncbi:MAG: hypothetical protein BLM47_06925 [Candidatus Reconcilbacillus cellulovorans]|uniref:Uncharacterized protein n=1 Tax=Candidatus Reconcilbacillus cellulovorans TaxID=1906605 RepID=A0A2A6DZZ4_9BACL|nr:MAG: hypothetical protein BLM47_06925 [Candidatus Reconcilbacillus cellulovorans]